MIFTSITFLAFYIALIWLLWLFKSNRARKYLLLGGSYFFYAWANPAFVLLLMASSFWGWYLGLLMDRTGNENRKSLYLSISLTLSLLMLAYYKYVEFFAENIVVLMGLELDYHLGIALPVGISFFTFQTISYGVDLRRGRIPVCKSLPQFMLFVAFFPQLVAGPIVRASEFLPQLGRNIKINMPDMVLGGQIFLGGAIQKVLFADNLSVLVDPVFYRPELFSSGTLWLALFAYSMQIFCDFSGYSLMAIGVARTLGFELPENFRMPYISRSITEFWRRWHITLSFWLRDYLYISLGGNRKGEIRTCVHLMITMLLGGLWHGASWNFVLWGAFHGVALTVHKLWTTKTSGWQLFRETWIYGTISWILTFLFVTILWIPFRCNDFKTAGTFFFSLFARQRGIEWIHPHAAVILAVIAAWHILFIIGSRHLLLFPKASLQKVYPQFVLGLALMMIFLFAPLNTSPFIYFQF